MRPILYVKTGCPFCAEMRRELEKARTQYDEINVSERREAIPELLKLTKGKRIVPVLVDEGGVRVAPYGG